jgi:hypothetical protein
MQALKLADERQIDSVKLDDTNQGQPLYEKLGFRREQSVERWWRPGATVVVREGAVNHGTSNDDWRTLDLRAFGADRTELLAHFPGGLEEIDRVCACYPDLQMTLS